MAAKRSFAKDFHDLMKNIKSFSDGQATVSNYDNHIGIFKVTISPKDGPFKEGEFVFEIVPEWEETYDESRVFCETAIYHPNIDTIQDENGEVCLNLLDNGVWTSDCSVQDIVQGLLFLMYNPNLEDPFCSAVSWSMSMEEFEKNVQKSIAGGRIGKYQFPVNARYARLHPSLEKEGGEGGRGKVGKDGEKDEHTNEVKDERRTEGEDRFVTKYFGIKEFFYRTPSSDDEDDIYNCGCFGTGLPSDEDDIDDDSDVVNDEDIFDLIEEIDDRDALVDAKNRKNLDGFESVVSWNKIVYGTENRTFVVNPEFLMEDQSTGPANSTSNLQGDCKEPGPSMTSSLWEVQRPTVASRFYNALQTRAFRRWLV